jgi:hypothetical protein
MNQVLNLSDIEVILSDEEAGSVIHSPSQASPPTRVRPAPDRADRARFVDGDLQALRPAQLPLRRRPRARPQEVSVHNRPRLGYVPNSAYAQVAEFLANFRKLQETLNEICAINAELLRRRESLD